MQIYFGVIYVTKRYWKILSFNFYKMTNRKLEVANSAQFDKCVSDGVI